MVPMTNSPEPTEPANDPAADIAETTDSTPTTAEEAMDADNDADGFVNESAYTPANP
jgi:hypothetical protein